MTCETSTRVSANLLKHSQWFCYNSPEPTPLKHLPRFFRIVFFSRSWWFFVHQNAWLKKIHTHASAQNHPTSADDIQWHPWRSQGENSAPQLKNGKFILVCRYYLDALDDNPSHTKEGYKKKHPFQTIAWKKQYFAQKVKAANQNFSRKTLIHFSSAFTISKGGTCIYATTHMYIICK